MNNSLKITACKPATSATAVILKLLLIIGLYPVCTIFTTHFLQVGPDAGPNLEELRTNFHQFVIAVQPTPRYLPGWSDIATI